MLHVVKISAAGYNTWDTGLPALCCWVCNLLAMTTGQPATCSDACIRNISACMFCTTSSVIKAAVKCQENMCCISQAASLSLDLRARQQQVDAMRGELQGAGSRLAAERQQTDQQAKMLMEQLAIAQSTSADTKVTCASV